MIRWTATVKHLVDIMNTWCILLVSLGWLQGFHGRHYSSVRKLSIVVTNNKHKDLSNSIIIISIQPEGQFWQEPEPSQATGMALAHCILGSFLGVRCHCFPPPLDVPTFASRCLHVQATWETSISERRNKTLFLFWSLVPTHCHCR